MGDKTFGPVDLLGFDRLLSDEERAIRDTVREFVRDNVLDGMWSVISPERGGDMAEYLHSLERMRRLRTAWLAPGHGERIDDARARSPTARPPTSTGNTRSG